MTIDRVPFFEVVCDTLARDAYFGVFLGPVHVRLLGGMERLRKDVPYEVIEALSGGGAFLMAASDPLRFEAPEVQARVERLREVLAPISMAQARDERDARAIAERLRSGLHEPKGP